MEFNFRLPALLLDFARDNFVFLFIMTTKATIHREFCQSVDLRERCVFKPVFRGPNLPESSTCSFQEYAGIVKVIRNLAALDENSFSFD